MLILGLLSQTVRINNVIEYNEVLCYFHLISHIIHVQQTHRCHIKNKRNEKRLFKTFKTFPANKEVVL